MQSLHCRIFLMRDCYVGVQLLCEGKYLRFELKLHPMLPHIFRDMVLEFVNLFPDSRSRGSLADNAEFKVSAGPRPAKPLPVKAQCT